MVYENGLIQLIQYRASTPQVGARPLVIVPPCINKFYIMDLQPENSLIRFMVEQGNTVFLMSWKNPHEGERNLTWDDYLELGAIERLLVEKRVRHPVEMRKAGQRLRLFWSRDSGARAGRRRR